MTPYSCLELKTSEATERAFLWLERGTSFHRFISIACIGLFSDMTRHIPHGGS